MDANPDLRAERDRIDREDARLDDEAALLAAEKSRLQDEFLAIGEDTFLQDAGSDAGAVRASIAWLHAGSQKLDSDVERRSELIEENPIVASGHIAWNGPVTTSPRAGPRRVPRGPLPEGIPEVRLVDGEIHSVYLLSSRAGLGKDPTPCI